MHKTLGLPYMGFYEDLNAYIDGEMNPVEAFNFRRKIAESQILQNELKKAITLKKIMSAGFHRQLNAHNINLAKKILKRAYPEKRFIKKIMKIAMNVFS